MEELAKNLSIGRRGGMKCIRYLGKATNGDFICKEIISNAYGNGYVNRNDGEFTESEWDFLVAVAKQMERGVAQ